MSTTARFQSKSRAFSPVIQGNVEEKQTLMVNQPISMRIKYWSLAEEEEPEEADSNNNKKVATEFTIQPTKTDEHRKREREERRASRRREIEITTNKDGKPQGSVTIETSITTDGVTKTKTNRFSRTDNAENKKNKEFDDKKEEENKIVENKNKDNGINKRSSVRDRFKKDENDSVINVTYKQTLKLKDSGMKSESSEKKYTEPKTPVVEEKVESVQVKKVESAKVTEGKESIEVAPSKNKSKFESKTIEATETKTPIAEEKIESIQAEKVESAKVTEEKKDNIAPLKNKSKFESKNVGANKRPQSMVDFKSKFENKSNITVDNKLNKRPVSMNIKSKFEQQNTQPAKVELKKTYSTPARTTSATTKTQKDERGVHTEVVTTIKEETKGEGSSKKEVKETKSVETKDTVQQHAEKTTTVTETKTAGGTMSVKKTETKVETKPVLKKTGSSASKSVEERMRERKQKEALAKKQQSVGRNAFKLKLESNAKPVSLKIGGGGVMGALTSPKTPTSGDSNIDKLLKWIAKRINQYPAVNVTNFTSSWADGIALCALMNYLLGDEAIDPLAVSSTDKRKNFALAIDTATKAGVPALIDADEMAGLTEMDRRSMITYLHTVYKVLWHDKQEKK